MADQIVVSENALGYLNATRPWVKFMAILGFISIAIMVLFGLLFMFGISNFPTRPGEPAPSAAFGAGIGFMYLLFALVFFMPSLFLYRYSKAIAAISSTGEGALEEALKHQKSYWKFIGIFAAVVVSIEVIIFAIAILIGLFAAAVHH